MSVTYGFYNSSNGDRKYDASQLSSIFDGIVKDGIFDSIGTAFAVTASSGLIINVGIGRAWFNHTWILNDAILPLEASASEVILSRIDAVVIEINSKESVRANSIKFVNGTPSSTPARPSMVSADGVYQYPLCYIYRTAGSTEITQSNITSVIGTASTPFVTGLLETVDISSLLTQWDKEMESMKNQLSSEVAAAGEGDMPNGFFTYTHSYNSETKVHNFVHVKAAGSNGKALITAVFTSGDTFAVDGTACPAYVGEDACEELPVGRWVTFVWDGSQLNFKAGGVALNFKVVGGTTRPESAKAGTIWAPFSLAVGSVTADVTIPASPASGDVWVALYTQSDAPITLGKKTIVVVYPKSVQQYNGTEWVGYDAEVYTGTEWVTLPFAIFLYNSGDECTALTGGWIKYGAHPGWTVTGGTKRDDHFSVGPGSTTPSSKLIMLGTTNLISLAKVSTISVDYIKTAVGTSSDLYKLKLCVSTANTDPVVATGVVASVVLSADVSTNHATATLDVSALTASYYIWIQSMSPDVGNVYSVALK